jgi:hypothetical protein
MSAGWHLFHQESRWYSNLFACHKRFSLARATLSRRAAIDNSPAFQRRVWGQGSSPAGTAEFSNAIIGDDGNFTSIQPSLRDLYCAAIFPALKRRAIFGMSRWDTPGAAFTPVRISSSARSGIFVAPTLPRIASSVGAAYSPTISLLTELGSFSISILQRCRASGAQNADTGVENHLCCCGAQLKENINSTANLTKSVGRRFHR